MKFVPRPLAAAKNTVNISRAVRRDPAIKKFREFGWEEPGARIGHTLTWLLNHAKNEGLSARSDGSVCVQDLLQHPRLVNLDFQAIERAIQKFRSGQLKLTYEPRNTPHGQISCWWVSLHTSTLKDYPGRRLIDSTQIPDMIYKVPTKVWETIRERGIPRGSSLHISLTTQNTVPFHHDGDSTFIRLDPHKTLNTNIPLYLTRTIQPKCRNRLTETIITPASNIPPTVFESAMRVAVQRFPLLSPPSALCDLASTGGSSKTKKKGKEKMVVVQSGVDALKKFGFGRIVQDSSLEETLKKQEERLEDRQERRRESIVGKEPPPSSALTPDIKTEKQEQRSISNRQRPTKHPPLLLHR